MAELYRTQTDPIVKQTATTSFNGNKPLPKSILGWEHFPELPQQLEAAVQHSESGLAVEEATVAKAQLKQLTPTQRDKLVTVAKMAKLASSSEQPRQEDIQATERHWRNFLLHQEAAHTPPLVNTIDPGVFLQWVLREAYNGNNSDLTMYAARLKFFTDAKKMLRDELTKVRHFQSQNQKIGADGQTELTASYTMQQFSLEPEVQADGTMTVRPAQEAGQTQDARRLDDYVKALEQQLNSCGDDAQLAQLDLQSMAQRQQQTLQSISGISKVLHETSMSIIRKISA